MQHQNWKLKTYISLLRRIKRKFFRIFLWVKILFQNTNESPPIYLPVKKSGIKVHLGAGDINIQGWVNIDARSGKHLHIVKDNLMLDEFVDGSISEIYLCHVLEHFSFKDVDALLINFRRKLSAGGTLRISVPSFDSLVSIYQENENNLSLIKGPLMGGQDYEFNFHKSVFNKQSLYHLLEDHGYKNILEWKTFDTFGIELGDYSNVSVRTKNGTYQVSLNLCCHKQNVHEV
jgi:predicted SAM-dependent methyltransferase